MEYADIAELDDRAEYVRVTWGKMINYASTFSKEFIALEAEFESGKYGPEWTFSRWLGVKCGMSRRTTYRVIEQLHRVASDDQREQIKRGVEEERRIAAQEKTDRRASQLAWNGWRAEEKQRHHDINGAYNEWLADEKRRIKAEKETAQQVKAAERQRIKAEKESERQAKAAEQKKAAARERDRAYKRRKKAEKDQQIKVMEEATWSRAKTAENGILVPNVAHADPALIINDAIERLVIALDQLAEPVRSETIGHIITRLGALLNGPREAGAGAGHARFDA